MAKPTKAVDWATLAAVSRVSDPSVLRGEGFPENHFPTSEEANFMFKALGEWITFFERQAIGYATLQDYLEDTDLADAPASNGDIIPALVRDSRGAGVSKDLDSGSLGNITVGEYQMATNGVYVAFQTATNVLSFYNCRDLVVVDTYTLSQTPITVQSVCMDMFRCWVAYTWNNGGTITATIEAVLLSTFALDTTWGTGVTGRVDLDTGASAKINKIQTVQRAIIFCCNANVAGIGALTPGNNVGFVDADGSSFIGFTPMAGNGVDIDFGIGRTILLTDNVGDNIAVLNEDFSTMYLADYSTDWSSIESVAISGYQLAIFGHKASATDPRIVIGSIKLPGQTTMPPAFTELSAGSIAYPNAKVFFDASQSLFALQDTGAASINPTIFRKLSVLQGHNPRWIGATVTSAGVLNADAQGFASVTKTGTGAYRCNFDSSIDGLPGSTYEMQCVATSRNTGTTPKIVNANYAAGSGWVAIQIVDNAGTAVDENFSLMCWWNVPPVAEDFSYEIPTTDSATGPYVKNYAFDGYRLWTAMVDPNATDAEEIHGYTLGYNSRKWIASDRDNDATKFSATPF